LYERKQAFSLVWKLGNNVYKVTVVFGCTFAEGGLPTDQCFS